jgi:hypothetical protein
MFKLMDISQEEIAKQSDEAQFWQRRRYDDNDNKSINVQ